MGSTDGAGAAKGRGITLPSLGRKQPNSQKYEVAEAAAELKQRSESPVLATSPGSLTDMPRQPTLSRPPSAGYMAGKPSMGYVLLNFEVLMFMSR